MNARETLACVAEAAPGWTLDEDSHARFATIAHPNGAVVELRQERESEPWTCDAGRPGSMHRRQAMSAAGAVLVAAAATECDAPEAASVANVAWFMVHGKNGTNPGTPARVAVPWGEPWKPEPLPVGCDRVDAIIASLPPGPDLRENILAAEVLRLRAERAALRADVDAAHSEAETAYLRTREPHYAGERDALELVQEWLDADGEGGGA